VSTNTPVTRQLAVFAHDTVFTDLPRDVVQLGKKAILDCLGLALAGSVTEGSIILRRHIAGLGCSGSTASIFGTNTRTHPRFAALANATSMHADDFDDTHNPTRVHPSTTVLGAVLAAAEATGASGKDVITAFNVGVEITCKISMATLGAHYARGYHATSSIGVFGATAGVCNIRGLSPETTLMALGIVGSESAGLRENFGTMAKPMHAGRAAESAIDAAELAEMGLSATPTVLEGPLGFFQVCVGKSDPEIILNTLGKPWTIANPGIAVKPFPSGRLTHPAMCKLEDLMKEHRFGAHEVKRMGVRSNRLLPGNLSYHRPVTGLQGKFSMEFCLASILVLGKAGLSEFTDETANRSDIQDAISKIDYTCYSDEEATANQYPLLATFLEIDLIDGRRIEARVDIARGSPPLSMTDEEVAEKFRQCAGFAQWPTERSERIIESALNLENIPSISTLTDLLLSPAG